METNDNINTTAEQVQPVQENEKHSLFEKLDKAKKKENTFGNKIDGMFSKLGKGFYKVRCVCCFTTLLSTIATIIIFSSNSSNGTAMTIAGTLFMIGILSSLLSCPGRIIGTAFVIIAAGFEIGLCFLGIGCIIGLVIGIAIGAALALYFPAIVTISYYFKELRYMKPE